MLSRLARQLLDLAQDETVMIHFQMGEFSLI